MNKIKFGNGKDKNNKKIEDKITIIYINVITIKEIPLEAYNCIVNGKSTIEWIMERYQIKKEPKSGITNNHNDWGKEIGNPRYILDLLLSIIELSLRTIKIIKKLPKIKFEN